MESTNHAVKQVLDELFSLLEAMETQSSAILLFLKDQKISTDEKLAPYLAQASNGASVKWRAARVRMEYLFSSTENQPAVPAEAKEKAAEKKESLESGAKEVPAGTMKENEAARQQTEGEPDLRKVAGSKTSERNNSPAKEIENAASKPGGQKPGESEKIENKNKKPEEHREESSKEKKEMAAAKDAKPDDSQERKIEKAPERTVREEPSGSREIRKQ